VRPSEATRSAGLWKGARSVATLKTKPEQHTQPRGAVAAGKEGRRTVSRCATECVCLARGRVWARVLRFVLLTQTGS
jgi:hypothetical protein